MILLTLHSHLLKGCQQARAPSKPAWPAQAGVSWPSRAAVHAQAAAAVPSVTSSYDYSLSSPAPGFNTIDEAIAAVAQGEFVLVLDDEDRENEGDLIMAAEKATQQRIAYMVEYTSGALAPAVEGVHGCTLHRHSQGT